MSRSSALEFSINIDKVIYEFKVNTRTQGFLASENGDIYNPALEKEIIILI